MDSNANLSVDFESVPRIYKCPNAGTDYVKGLISEIKKLNPDVQISGQWIEKNYRKENLTISSSVPLEKLNMPGGYYGNALDRIIFPQTPEDIATSVDVEALNYSVGSNHVDGFTSALQQINPNAQITVEYDKENRIGKINSSIPLDKINYPEGYFGGFGLDKDGYIGYLQDRVIDYKIEDELDGMDSSKQFTEVTKRYFGEMSYKDVLDRKLTQEVSSSQTHEEPVTGQEEKKQETEEPLSKQEESPVASKDPDPLQELVNMQKEQRRFTILQRERTMNNEQQARRRSALLAGACLLGACAALYFNGADVSQVVQQEINAINSWSALGQYFSDIGPMTTLLAVSAGGFMSRYLNHSRKFRDAQQQFIDMNNAKLIQDNEIQENNELGGDTNARAR